MRCSLFLLCFLLGFSAISACAEEGHATEGEVAAEGEHGEGHEKKKPPEKPKPDSVISSVLALPVVKKWDEWMQSKGTGSKMVAWGEFIKEVHGSKCWSIVVAEENTKGVDTIWKRFCMQQTGLEMWVESTLGASNTDEINYITYESWLKNCEPAYNSPGKC